MNLKVLMYIIWCTLFSATLLHGQDEMNISIECEDGIAGSQRCFTFSSSAVADLEQVQFTISYDPTVLFLLPIPDDFQGSCLTSLSSSNFNNLNNGQISFLWYNDAVTVTEGCELFTICFNLIGNPGDSSIITLTNSDAIISAGTIFGEIDVNYTPCYSHIIPDDLVIISNYCNPTQTGLSDGSLQFYVAGGTGPYMYSVKNLAGTTIKSGSSISLEKVDVTGLPNGQYTITISDATNTVRMRPVGIFDTSRPSFTLKAYDPTCFTRSDGLLKIENINVLNEPYTIKWSNGEFLVDTIDQLNNGKYSVSIVDANGCITKMDTTLLADTLIMGVTIIDSAYCKGMKDGILSVTGFGGIPFNGNAYEATFNTANYVRGTSPIQLTNVPAGNVTVKLRDNSVNRFGVPANCEVERNVFVPYKNTATFTVMNKVDVKCFGEKTGQIAIQASGTGTNYSINIYEEITKKIYPNGVNGPMGVHLNNDLAAGSYYVVAKSLSPQMGCLDTFAFNIKGPLSKFIVTPTVVQPSCVAPGSITLSPKGGTPGYTYQWENADNSQNRNNLNPGSYSVTVTDMSLCDTIINFVLVNSGASAANPVVLQAISCKDYTDGIVTVDHNSSSTNITYLWEDLLGNQWNTRTVNNLGAGIYNVTVTIDGCVTTGNVPLVNPDGVVITSFEKISPECPRGGFKGSLGVTINGGFSPYTYEWKKQGNAAIIGDKAVLPNLDPGTYTVKIADQKLCAKDTTFILDAPQDFVVNIANIIDVSCHGIKDGQARATASLGPVNNNKYSFLWSNGFTSSIFNPSVNITLAAGPNWVIVSDAKCFSDTIKFNIGDKPEIFADVTVKGICAGSCTGQIDVIPSGGSLNPLVVSWPGLGIPDGGSAYNLCAGSYPFVVTDGNNCTLEASAQIIAADTLEVVIDPQLTTPLSCKTSIGQIGVQVLGGTPNFQYTWTDGLSFSNIANNLDEGNYGITVTDAAGCTASVSYVLERPNPVKAEIASPVPPSCFGGTTCIVVESASGGTGSNYTMQINNGLRIPIDSCLKVVAGDYLVSIFDGAGCKTDYPVIITQPEAIVVDLGEDFEINLGEETADIQAAINSTFPIINYTWLNIGDDLACVDTSCVAVKGIPKDDLTISLVVTDENGCTASDELNIIVNDERKVYFANIFKTSGSEMNRLFDIKTGFGVEQVEYFTIYDRWGAIVYHKENYLPDPTSGWNGLINGSQALPGVYVFRASVRFIDGVRKLYSGDVALIK